MDTPLPDVIDPGSFRCLRIWIPDDPGYRRAVMGAVSYLQNWFAWERDEEHRGREAAAVFRQAYTLTVEDMIAGLSCDCDNNDNSTPPTAEEVEDYARGGATFLSEEDMGQVVTDVTFDPLTGKLRVYYGHCCYTDIELTSFVSSSPGDIEAPEITDPVPTGVACRKAYHIARELVSYMQTGYDLMPAFIWDWSADMRSGDQRRFDISNGSIVKMFEIYNALWQAQSIGWVDLWTNTDTRRLTCLLEPHLSGDNYGLTREEYDAMKSAKGNSGNAITQLVLNTTWDAFNFSNISLLCAEAVSMEEVDCTCPDSLTDLYPYEEFEGDWLVYWDLMGTQPIQTTLTTTDGISIITSSGLTVQANTTGSEFCQISRDTDVQTGTITNCYVEVEYHPDFEWGINGIAVEGLGNNNQNRLPGNGGIEYFVVNGMNIGVSSAMQIMCIGTWSDSNTPHFPYIRKVVWCGTGAAPFNS